jgi:hypothetical protein
MLQFMASCLETDTVTIPEIEKKPTFIESQGSLCLKFRRTHQLELK